MAETHGFVQVPPDSSGKRLTHSVMVECRLGTMTGVPGVGEACHFGTSNLVGTISEVDFNPPSTYDIHVSLKDPVPNNAVPIVGEAFFENEVQIGVVAVSGNLFYFPQNVIVGGTNNINQLEIDATGAARVSFEGGSPSFDAFGKTQVSQQHVIASYTHTYDTLNDLFTTVTAGTGSITHEPNVAGVRLSCGTDSGAKVVRTSDLYHPYQPGVSQLLIFTGVIGDAGKANVVRRAGLYDDENGLFFEMYESTFNVVLRSKSTGSVIEYKVPSTEWNHDRMDGSGGVFNPSGVMVDPTKDNIFWIDYQWLGAGAIRFGIYVNGKRVLIHSFDNTNLSSHSYMTTASLPFRYEQENIGASASTSEFRIFCATVMTEGTYNPRRILVSATTTKSITSLTATPVISIRPVSLIGTKPNRGTLYMYKMQIYNHGVDPVMVELHRGAVTADGSWSAVYAGSIAESNTTATTSSGGVPNWFMVVPPNEMVQVAINAFDENRQGFRRKADHTIAVEQVMTARLLTGTTGGLVTAVVAWDEVKV